MTTITKASVHGGSNMLEQILNSTNTMIFWKDAERRFIGVNKAFLDYYGFSDEKMLLGKTDEDMGWHSNPNPFEDDEWKVIHQGISTHLVHGKCMARGQERDIMASKSPLYDGDKIVGLVGSFIDVTEQLKQQDELGRLTRKLDGIPGGVAVFKRYFDELQCISVNKCLEDMLGVNKDDILGKSLHQLAQTCLEPGECERFLQDCKNLLGSAKLVEGTYRFHNMAKNASVWIHQTCQLVREPGDEELLYCSYANVNQLVHYKDKLAETEQLTEKRYAYAKSTLRDGKETNIVAKGHYNFTQNKVLQYESYLEKIYSFDNSITYDEAFNGFMKLTYVSVDRKRLMDTLSREHILKAFEQGQTHLEVNYRRMLGSKEPIWLSFVLQTFVVPKTGDVEGFSNTYDITEHMLQKSIVSNLDGLGYDELGFIYKSSGFWRCFQYHNAEQRNTPVHKIHGDWQTEVERYAREEVVPSQRDQVLRRITMPVILDRLSQKDVYTVTNAIRLADGSLRQKQIQFFYQGEGKEIVFYGMSDITDQFMKENLQIANLAAAKLAADNANQSKSNFLSNMSHDLRTPLNGILGFTDLAIKEKDPQQKQIYLHKIKTSGKLLEELVNDTLEMSRIESGKIVLNPEVVDGKDFWESVVTALLPAANMAGVHLETNMGAYPEENIKVDKLQVKKVLLNLISNAIKYTPAGGKVKVEIQALKDDKNGFTRRLLVEDTGIGMYPEFIERMFEPFAQENRPETKNIVGTGLGLSIVKRIVDLMGGKITVQSKVHKGTSIVVDLPIECWPKDSVSIKQMKEDSKHKTEIVAATLENKHVLLCEDNYLNAEIATLLLKDKKMQVEWVKDGLEGLTKFRDNKPGTYDLILMDVRMPNMDGYVATKAIRHLCQSDAKTIPIVAMSANAFAEDIKEAKACGMNDYITKPVDPVRLYETLAKYLK
jgi:PAS domain S-box-containing protein